MEETEIEVRVARPVAAGAGGLTYSVTLTPSDRTDPVVLYYEPVHVLPVVFVPGIMGSNLCDIKNERRHVWRLDAIDIRYLGPVPLGLAGEKVFARPGRRQRDLHPDRTRVDPGGNTPGKPIGSVSDRRKYATRGWGEVGEASYHAFLSGLEELLNDHRTPVENPRRVADYFLALMNSRPKGGERDAPWRPIKPFEALSSKEIERMDDWLMPVYAFGYNWLQDNRLAAEKLAKRIEEIIATHDDGSLSFCKQVILITHSMGGLVARACAKLPGMEPRIAGVVHGVMPTNGAAVAYRRCKVGMADEDLVTAAVIGRTGKHVTAVFAQSPGALELLPTQNYARGWLEVNGPNGHALQEALPLTSPYDEIYGRRDRWWALVREEWLEPEGGIPQTWENYRQFLDVAAAFHSTIGKDDYHRNTYVFYGADNAGKTPSFERIVWTTEDPWNGLSDVAPTIVSPRPSPSQVKDMTPQQVDLQGVNPEVLVDRVHWGGPSGVNSYGLAQYRLRVGSQNGSGDGTVPASSGRAPADCPGVKQVFRLTGIEHEPAFLHATAQQVTVYSLIKIAADALWPESGGEGAGK